MSGGVAALDGELAHQRLQAEALESHWPEARKRALLARVIDVYRWRGTAYGLERVIEACLGARPEIAVAADNPHVFRVIVRPLANYGLPNHLRITTGTAAQNERLLAAMAVAVAAPP